MPRLRRIVLGVLAVAAALYAVTVVWRQNERAAGLDFYIYFVAGQMAGRADVDNIYAPEVQERVGEEYYARAQSSSSELRKYDAQRRRRLDLVSSPFLFTTLGWFSRDYELALLQNHVLVLISFVAGVLLLCAAARVPWEGAAFLMAALLLWYRGFEADLRVGNVNSIQLAVLGVFVWLQHRSQAHPKSAPELRQQPATNHQQLFGAASWILLGALLLFKPNLLFVPLLLIAARVIRREVRRASMDVAFGAIGALAAFVIASIRYGSPRVWLQWIDAAGAFYQRLPGRAERNVTPALSLILEHGEWVSYVLATILLLTVLAALARWKSDDTLLLTGLGVLVYLISANVVWLHYMVLVIPMAVALMRWRSTAAVAILALLLIAEEPFEWLLGRPAFPVESMLITPALAALFLCGVWKLSHRDPEPALG